MHETPIPDAIPFRTGRPLRGITVAVLGVLVLLGVAAFAFAVVAGEPIRLWQSMLVNWLFWSSMGIGMVIFAVAIHITEGDWAWSVRRIAMAGAGFLPISFLLFPIVLFGGYELYFAEWLAVGRGEVQDAIVERKLAWLNMPALGIRNIVGIAVLYGLALWFVYLAVRPDVYGAGEPRHRRLYDRLTRGWRGVRAEAVHSRRTLNNLAPVLALLFTLIWGMVGMDMAMTMEAHWFSTMFPVAFFVTAFLGGVAATAIATTFLRRDLGLEPYITARTYHDLGKLVFAFAVFWMYINWSQYIVIWYGLLPHEQSWMVRRLTEPYAGLVGLTVVLVFALPFFGLLARPPKKVPAILSMFAGFILVGHWVERYLLVAPSMWRYETITGLPLGLTELGITLGFLGLFVGSYLWMAARIPLLPSPVTLEVRAMGIDEQPEVMDPSRAG